jgi:hypothetical protein
LIVHRSRALTLLAFTVVAGLSTDMGRVYIWRRTEDWCALRKRLAAGYCHFAGPVRLNWTFTFQLATR